MKKTIALLLAAVLALWAAPCLGEETVPPPVIEWHTVAPRISEPAQVDAPEITIEGVEKREYGVSFVLGETIVIKWQAVDGVKAYRVAVVDEEDREVNAFETTDTRVVILASELSPGVAYALTVTAIPVNGTLADGASKTARFALYAEPTPETTPEPTPTPEPTTKPTPTPEPTPKPTPTPVPAPTPQTAYRPVLRSDTMTEGKAMRGDYEAVVLGNPAVRRKDIHTVTFVDTLAGAGADAWDVSAAGDGSALAWVNDGALTIAGRGGVTAPEDASYLFARYDEVERIDFNGCFLTGGTKSMRHMFLGDGQMESVDLSGFDTGNVKDMGGMFEWCNCLLQLDVSSFDTRKVTNMSDMFVGCKWLTELDVGGFDTGNVEDMLSMFSECESLESLDLTGFNTCRLENMSWMFDGCTNLERVEVGDGFVLVDTGMNDLCEEAFGNCPAVVVRDGETLSASDWLDQAIITRRISRGEQGSKVVWLQRVLIRLGYYSDLADGVYGKNTQDAVAAFQADNGIRQDGAVNHETICALCAAAAALGPAPAPVGALQTGEISDSWEQIIAAIDDGTASQRYAVGATKALDLGDLGTIHMQLAGFDLDERADGNGKAATTWIAVELLPERHVMNEECTSEGGWRASNLRAYLKNTVYQALPGSLRQRVVSVRKSQYDGYVGSYQTTEDLVWIPDKAEIVGEDSLYYSLFTDKDENRVKQVNGSAASWWLRSATNYTYFGYVYISGMYINNSATNAYGVALGFCL